MQAKQERRELERKEQQQQQQRLVPLAVPYVPRKRKSPRGEVINSASDAAILHDTNFPAWLADQKAKWRRWRHSRAALREQFDAAAALMQAVPLRLDLIGEGLARSAVLAQHESGVAGPPPPVNSLPGGVLVVE